MTQLHNLHIDQALEYIGKSELDSSITQLFTDLKLKTPIKRPRRDEGYTHVEMLPDRLYLVFEPYEDNDSMPQRKENELYCSGVQFVFEDGDHSWLQSKMLPLNIDPGWSRADSRKHMGLPSWSSPVLSNDRWVVAGTKVLLCFDKGQSKLLQASYSLAK